LVLEHLYFSLPRAPGELRANLVDIFEGTLEISLVFAVESHELVTDGVPRLAGRVGVDTTAGEHDKRETAKALVHLDADPARVLARAAPAFGLGLIMVVVADQVVGDAQQHGAEAAIGAAAQGTVHVYLIGVITRWAQAGAAGDVIGIGVVLNGAQFTARSAALTTQMPGKAKSWM